MQDIEMLEKNVIIRKENNVTSYAKTRATDRLTRRKSAPRKKKQKKTKNS